MPFPGLLAANQAGAFNQGGGGFSLPQFGFGAAAGSAFGDFFGSLSAFQDFNRDLDLATEQSAAVLRNLLGGQIGNQVGQGQDVVGGRDDPRSRFLTTGTVVSSDFGGGTLGFPLSQTGGINPLVVSARERLFNLLKTQAIQPQDLARQNQTDQFNLGAQLNATSQPSSTNPLESLGSLLNFAGAGQAPANNTIQAALANRAFGQQAASSGVSFLNQLFSTAAGVF